VGASLFGATPKREAIAPPGFYPFFLGTEKGKVKGREGFSSFFV
jgi:hypothetical protein